jgi:hypothetical protein
MLLSEIFTDLAHGELSQLAAGTNNSGSVAAEDFPKIITYINQGLTSLHTRLPLRMDQVEIQTDYVNKEYLIHSRNAVSVREDGFILDSINSPFENNLLLIDEVFNEKGDDYTLNSSEAEYSLFTPRFNLLQVPEPKMERLAVIYRADHPKLAVSARIDPASIHIEIPESLREALLTFVHSKILAAQGSAEGLQEASLQMNKFNFTLAELKDLGLIQQDSWGQSTDNFRKNGWV